jgi:hypothetical protein
MEANNGYEYRIVKVRNLGFNAQRATERAVERACRQGWEVINTSLLEGVVPTPVVTLRRPRPESATTARARTGG